MASPRRSAKHSVSELLQSEPYRFSFVQAVRLLEESVRNKPDVRHIGGDALPSQECVRFAGYSARSFPPSEVVSLEEEEDAGTPTAKITVAFMGLYGPSGVLPYHDTQRIIDHGSKQNPERDFLDLFNHRIVSLFYRAATKYRIPFAYEDSYHEATPDQDVVTRSLYSVAGMGLDGLRGRLEIRDELAIEFAGLFGHRNKNAVGLTQMLGCYFNLPIDVEQFSGQWLKLSEENCSEMPSRQIPLGQNCQLGTSFVIGDRLWDISGKFRIQLGPLTKSQFDQFLPGTDCLVELAQIVQLYAGNQFDFDIQLILQAAEVPEIQLGQQARLGQNTWLITKSTDQDKSDAVFRQSGLPLAEKRQHAA